MGNDDRQAMNRPDDEADRPEPGPEGHAVPDPDDIDARFSSIVAGWSNQPVADRPDMSPSCAHPEEDPGPRTTPTPPSAADGWRLHAPVEPEEEHFEPPEPDPLPTPEEDPNYWGILIGLVGGLALLAYVLFFDRYASGWWTFLAISMIVGGFVLLVARGGRDRDDDDHGIRL